MRVQPVLVPTQPSLSTPGTGGFGAALAAASAPPSDASNDAGARAQLAEQLRAIATDEREVADAITRLESGAALSPAELLRVQALVYRYAERVDVATKVLDKTAAGLKQLLNIQL